MNLTNKNIDIAVEDIREFFQRSGVSRRDTLKICLVVEKALLRYQEHFGEEKDFTVNRKKWFGTPKVIVRLTGEPFDPLQNVSDNDLILNSAVMQKLLNFDAAGTVYRYENGCNELISFSTQERKSIKIPGGQITIAILAAIIGSLLMNFLPQDVQEILLVDVVSPILSTLMSLIVTLTVFMMFFSIVSSICAIEDTAMLSNIGVTVGGRFFVLIIMILALAILISSLFFPVFSISGDTSINVGEIINLLMSIVPTNILAAFTDSNVLQVAVMAFLVGICITTIANRIPNVKLIVTEINVLIFNVMSRVFKIIPLTIFLCIFKTLSSNNFADFFVVWKLVIAELITYLIVIAAMLIRQSLVSGLSIRDFAKKISPVAVIALTTGSSIAAFPKNLEIAKQVLHIDEKFSAFWLPIALVTFCPSILIEMVVCSFFVTSIAGATISVMQLILIIFIAVQLSIATPKVAGGIAASFTIMLTQLGFPLEMIGSLMIANVILDNVFSMLNVCSHDCELVTVAHKMGFVNLTEDT